MVSKLLGGEDYSEVKVTMLVLKSCPRCRGDMNTNKDMYGEYKECLQCGHMVDIEKPNSLFAMETLRIAATVKPKRKAA